MKFKFKIKIFNTKNLSNKTVPGILYIDNNIYYIYVLKNNLINKVFKNSFLNVLYYKKNIKVYIKNTKFSFIKNSIISFELKNVLFLKYKIKTYNNINNYTCKIDFLCKNNFPRKIKLNIFKIKKKFKYKDFNFKFKINKIIFFKKYITNTLN
ncbi:hypothetical protein CRP_040 [Candidatus Carsonella ruddii PV]|uniref:Uncharacterized protein n=1 Tax=Carsonella ruddii (strain PV) TaxID=387662 RepID=Q05FV0_CARRP|nr:hypothetical protein [Candidatus Carsonella ruddii]BAF35071.1 hypothetical protein CRP_040 [Candidatus Carsonella ruddii PV]